MIPRTVTRIGAWGIISLRGQIYAGPFSSRTRQERDKIGRDKGYPQYGPFKKSVARYDALFSAAHHCLLHYPKLCVVFFLELRLSRHVPQTHEPIT
ncbi:hypothetical protein J1614_009049 [Plenodomus biglobosus]|nr:hypothetical protein J1614_009049 [Plenodomus biglobosus]